VGFPDAEFRRAADVETAWLTKGLKETVEEDLRLTLFVTVDGLLAPGGEFSEFVRTWHASFVAECGRGVSKDCAPAWLISPGWLRREPRGRGRCNRRWN